MLALADDAALARLVIAATAIPVVHVYASKLSDRGRGHARPASNGLRTHGILPTKDHRRRYSMPPLRRPRRGPEPDRPDDARSNCSPRLTTAASSRCWSTDTQRLTT